MKGFLKNSSYLFLGLVVLYFSAQGVIYSTSRIANELNLSVAFVSIFIVAFGTNLPEVVFSIQAARQGKKEMIMGNMMGSLSVNSAVALGIAGVIQPIFIKNTGIFYTSALFSILSLLMIFFFLKTSSVLNRKEGVALICLYVIFVVVAFWVR